MNSNKTKKQGFKSPVLFFRKHLTFYKYMYTIILSNKKLDASNTWQGAKAKAHLGGKVQLLFI